jgi:hypothetical protein
MDDEVAAYSELASDVNDDNVDATETQASISEESDETPSP